MGKKDPFGISKVTEKLFSWHTFGFGNNNQIMAIRPWCYSQSVKDLGCEFRIGI